MLLDPTHGHTPDGGEEQYFPQRRDTQLLPKFEMYCDEPIDRIELPLEKMFFNI